MDVVLPVQLPWECPACRNRQLAAWPLALRPGDSVSWGELLGTLSVTCGRCRTAALPTVPAGLYRLMTVFSAEELAVIVREHPDLHAAAVTGSAAVLRLPEAAGPLAEALDGLLRDLPGPAHADRLAPLYQRFARQRSMALQTIGEAGFQRLRWLEAHAGTPDEHWDSIAQETEQLLGMSGQVRDRAAFLLWAGVRIARRPRRTPADVDRALEWLELSRQLWHGLNEPERASAAAGNLAAALALRQHGDALADLQRAEELFDEVMTYYRAAGRDADLAQSATNRASALTRLAGFQTGEQAEETLRRAVALCREVEPLRPKHRDPLGWAFTATNKALALTRLSGDDPVEHRSRLTETVRLYRATSEIFDDAGDADAAHQARYLLGRALVELAGLLDERRRIDRLAREPVEGVDRSVLAGTPAEQHRYLVFLRSLDSSPAVHGYQGSTRELHAILESLPEGPAVELLAEAERIAATGVERARTAGNQQAVSQFARVAAAAAQSRYGRTEAVTGPLATARSLIDHRYAPLEAAETALELAAVHARHGNWPQARDAYDDCLGVQEWVLANSPERDLRIAVLANAPKMPREAAFVRVRCGDHAGAVTLLERTRLRTYETVVRSGEGGRLGLLNWPRPSLADIAGAATPECPIAYVLTAPRGSVVLLVHADATVRVFEVDTTSGDYFLRLHQFARPELSLYSAQQTGADMSAAVAHAAAALTGLLQPVVDALAADGVGRLCLVPCGPMAAMPWAATPVRDPGTGATAPIGDLLVLSTSPSAAAVALSRRRVAEARPRRDAGPVVVFADPARPDAPPLPGARAEARRVEHAFGDRVVLRTREAATRAELGRLIPDCWIAHFACHGQNNAMQFESARLLLADGDLTIADLRRLPPFGARLVVLSACQTGQVDFGRLADDMIGLPAALLATGAAAVVGTLWPVDDRATALLVGRFYDELAAMLSRGEPDDAALALSRAQRWLRTATTAELRGRAAADDRRPYRDPYYWAGFFLVGS